MNENQQTNIEQRDMETLKQRIAKRVYFPVLLVLVTMMTAISITGLNVIYWTSDMPDQFTDEPVWLVEDSLLPLRLAFEVSDPGTSDSAKALGAITILLSGMIMGIFLQRSRNRNNNIEQYIVIVFLALAVLQLVTLIWLPNPEKAGLNMSNGKEITLYLNSLLTRYSGIATAICGAALGFNASSGKNGEPQ